MKHQRLALLMAATFIHSLILATILVMPLCAAGKSPAKAASGGAAKSIISTKWLDESFSLDGPIQAIDTLHATPDFTMTLVMVVNSEPEARDLLSLTMLPTMDKLGFTKPKRYPAFLSGLVGRNALYTAKESELNKLARKVVLLAQRNAGTLEVKPSELLVIPQFKRLTFLPGGSCLRRMRVEVTLKTYLLGVMKTDTASKWSPLTIVSPNQTDSTELRAFIVAGLENAQVSARSQIKPKNSKEFMLGEFKAMGAEIGKAQIDVWSGLYKEKGFDPDEFKVAIPKIDDTPLGVNGPEKTEAEFNAEYAKLQAFPPEDLQAAILNRIDEIIAQYTGMAQRMNGLSQQVKSDGSKQSFYLKKFLTYSGLLYRDRIFILQSYKDSLGNLEM